MTTTHIGKIGQWFRTVLVLLVLAGLIWNTVLLVGLSARIDALDQFVHNRWSGSCTAMPMSLIHEDPICAEKFLRSVGVTNIHIDPPGTPLIGWNNSMVRQAKEMLAMRRNVTNSSKARSDK